MNIETLKRMQNRHVRECKVCHRVEWRAYQIYRHIKDRHKLTGFTKNVIIYN